MVESQIEQSVGGMITVFIRSLEILILFLLLAFSYYAKILDWILILVACLAVTAWAVIHNRSDDLSSSGLLALYFSANIFWWIIKQYRRSWHTSAFWVTMGILMTVQIGVFYLFTRSVGELKPIWIFPISLVEIPIMIITLDWALHRFVKRHKSHHEVA